jgi:hypothetical protein
MIAPEFADADSVLEYAAQVVERDSFADLAGIAARRKRDREDAALRRQTREETREECAESIRACKSRRDRDAVAVLRDLAELPRDRCQHGIRLLDAWPLAWKGWLNINCTIQCNSNSVPPETDYWIEITDAGRAVLAKAAARDPRAPRDVVPGDRPGDERGAG